MRFSLATVLPDRSHVACNVDGEVAGYQKLEEHEGLNRVTGKMKVSLGYPEKAEGGDNAQHSENRTDREHRVGGGASSEPLKGSRIAGREGTGKMISAVLRD